MSALAERMIDKFGEVVTFTTYTKSYANQTTTRSDPVTHDVKVGVEPISEQEIDGSAVIRGDMRLWVRAADITFEPEPGLVLARADGTKWTVVGDRSAITTYGVQGVKVAYALQVRAKRK